MIMFFVPALAALATGSNVRLRFDAIGKIQPIWVLVLFILTALIGWRFQVGGDWFSYLRYYYRADEMSFADLTMRDDPGYWLVNIVSSQLGWGVIGVNALCGFLFSIGLVFFCRNLPRPWLALAVAVPYMVIVVAMGYSRQGVALGFAMLALVALGRDRFVLFAIWVVLGALFHKTAVLLLPIAALTATKNRFLIGAIVLVTFFVAYQVLLDDAVERYADAYLESEMQSAGAFIRLLMNVVPAAIFIGWHRRFAMPAVEVKLWKLFSLISIVLFLGFFVTAATTALDRIALYMIPLQLVVFSYFTDVFGRAGTGNRMIVLAVLCYYAAVLLVWLNFAVNAAAWIPYRMYF